MSLSGELHRSLISIIPGSPHIQHKPLCATRDRVRQRPYMSRSRTTCGHLMPNARTLHRVKQWGTNCLSGVVDVEVQRLRLPLQRPKQIHRHMVSRRALQGRKHRQRHPASLVPCEWHRCLWMSSWSLTRWAFVDPFCFTEPNECLSCHMPLKQCYCDHFLSTLELGPAAHYGESY